MTNRERFHAVFEADPSVDRCPIIEWASWWGKTLTQWEAAGLPKGLSRLEINDYFGLDPNIQIWFPHYGTGFWEKNNYGDALVKDEADYREIKKQLFPENSLDIIMQEIENAIQQYEAGAFVWYSVEGYFWFPRMLMGIEPHMLAFYDKPDLYHRICEDLLEWQLRRINEFARYIKADFMTIAEDMHYNHGSMISKELFEEFVAPYYHRLLPEIKKYGTHVIIDTDGDISESVPWYIAAGVDGILPLEHQAGVDIGKLQKMYPGFFWLGGFDKMCLMKDEAAIDQEFERILPMLRKGRFLPSVDHQTPPGTTMENYRYYIARFRQISIQACKDAAG